MNDNVTELPPRMGPIEQAAAPEIDPAAVKEDKVVAFGPGRLDEAALTQLKEKRLLREKQEAVELEYVGPGEVTIGVLTHEERVIYTEMCLVRAEIDIAYKELRARSHEMIAKAIRNADLPENVLRHLDETVLFPSEEDAKDHYAMETQYQYLRAVFDMSVRERYGHHAVYGIRSGFTVVRVGYKYKLPQELKDTKLQPPA